MHDGISNPYTPRIESFRFIVEYRRHSERANLLIASGLKVTMIILSVNNSADIYGSSRCLLRMMELFAKAGHDVHVVVPCTGPLIGLLEDKGIRVHIHKNLAIIERTQYASFAGKLMLLFRYPLSALWLARLILRLNVDLVHTNSGVLPRLRLPRN